MGFSLCLCLTDKQRGDSHITSHHRLSLAVFGPSFYAHACGFVLRVFLAMRRHSYPIIWPGAFAAPGGVSRDRQIGSLLFPRNLRTFDATSPAHSPSPMGNFLVSRGRARTTNSRVDSTEQREPLWPLSRPPVLPSVHVKICLSHPMKRDPSRK